MSISEISGVDFGSCEPTWRVGGAPFRWWPRLSCYQGWGGPLAKSGAAGWWESGSGVQNMAHLIEILGVDFGSCAPTLRVGGAPFRW